VFDLVRIVIVLIIVIVVFFAKILDRHLFIIATVIQLSGWIIGIQS